MVECTAVVHLKERKLQDLLRVILHNNCNGYCLFLMNSRSCELGTVKSQLTARVKLKLKISEPFFVTNKNVNIYIFNNFIFIFLSITK